MYKGNADELLQVAQKTGRRVIRVKGHNTPWTRLADYEEALDRHECPYDANLEEGMQYGVRFIRMRQE